LSASVLAGVAVGAGIGFESVEYSTAAHRIAKHLVIWGVVVESVCTVSLFVFDEGISSRQQAQMITLEKRLVARTISDEQAALLKDR
jgi:hypothetical protein